MDSRADSDQDQSPSTPTNYALMTEAEREAEFRRQHQQYIAVKIARKKQMRKLIRAGNDSSSSDDSSDDDNPSSSSSSSQEKRKNEWQKQTGKIQTIKIDLSSKQEVQKSEKFPILSLKKGGEWVKDLLELQGDSVTILNIPYDVKIFNKIKIMHENTQGYPFRIKLSYEKSQLLFSSTTTTQQRQGLNTSYYVFAHIIREKLRQEGVKLREPKEEKIIGAPESITNNSYIYGKIFKKSQLFGKWQERFVVINKDGLFSYKKFNQKHTMYFSAGSVQELWTRFEIQDDMLVVKVMQGGKKTQLGIPVTEIVCKNSWLYNIFTLMPTAKK